MSLSEKEIVAGEAPQNYNPVYLSQDVREAVRELKARSHEWSERGQFNEKFFESDFKEIFGEKLT